MLKVLDNEVAQEEQAEGPTLDELAREGARRMLMKALAVEVAQYVEEHGEERDAQGRRLVVRNGRAQARKVTCGAGTLEVQAPRINDTRVEADGQRQRFTSRILPPYMRRAPKVAEVLPILYLRGLSTGDFREALPVWLGEDAAGLSATNIARLTAVWDEEYRQFRQRDLADRDYVYVWVDGIHFNIRLEDDRLCTLVMIGARPDGTKELIALEDGYRESTESWADVLRDLRRRGMRASPLGRVGHGFAASHGIDAIPSDRSSRPSRAATVPTLGGRGTVRRWCRAHTRDRLLLSVAQQVILKFLQDGVNVNDGDRVLGPQALVVQRREPRDDACHDRSAGERLPGSPVARLRLRHPLDGVGHVRLVGRPFRAGLCPPPRERPGAWILAPTTAG